MQGLDLSGSRSDFIPQSAKTIAVPNLSGNLYSILKQEVELGGQALEQESAEMNGNAALGLLSAWSASRRPKTFRANSRIKC